MSFASVQKVVFVAVQKLFLLSVAVVIFWCHFASVQKVVGCFCCSSEGCFCCSSEVCFCCSSEVCFCCSSEVFFVFVHRLRSLVVAYVKFGYEKCSLVIASVQKKLGCCLLL
ncbi:hypothetical protein Pint_26309 [Pistacia integerrima]|uniref:Uncharacterized protein n=1 Tax=Pistacia integerrima TaxID=434235 RepID=A0ACC0YFI1_9ROSI|nr:hypothetical protein Pint_26309 [Pistacia integerrima]